MAAKQALQAPGWQKTAKGRRLSYKTLQLWLLAHCAHGLKTYLLDMQGIAETIGASTLMGRAAIPIKKYADNDGTEFDEWIEMGKGSFSNDNGCVS